MHIEALEHADPGQQCEGRDAIFQTGGMCHQGWVSMPVLLGVQMCSPFEEGALRACPGGVGCPRVGLGKAQQRPKGQCAQMQ